MTQAEPLQLWAVIDEAVLRRTVGGPQVMRAQLDRLMETADAPNVTVQVLPFSSGTHPGASGAFQVLEFPEPGDPDVVFLKNLTDSLYVEQEADVYRYTIAFDHLRAKALDPDESRRMMGKVAMEARP